LAAIVSFSIADAGAFVLSLKWMSLRGLELACGFCRPVDKMSACPVAPQKNRFLAGSR
jgi:hypothetical protein